MTTPIGRGGKREAMDQVISSLKPGVEYGIHDLVKMCELAPGKYKFIPLEVAGYIRGAGMVRTCKGMYVREEAVP